MSESATPSANPSPAPRPMQLAPLPVPAVNSAFKPGRRQRRSGPKLPNAALIPLFHAAVLFLAGIVAARYFPPRPALLLIVLLFLMAIAVACIRRALRWSWLPLAAVWMLLGAWSAETEPVPAPNPEVVRLSDGLLRTVEGTVTDAGPPRFAEPVEQNQDADPLDFPTPEDEPGRRMQRIDLQLAAAEVVTDISDAVVPIGNPRGARVRITVYASGGQTAPIRCGQRLQVVLRLLPPETYLDPGVWNRAAFLEAQEIAAIGSVDAAKSDGNQPRLALAGQPARSFSCVVNGLRNAASARLQSLPEVTRSLPGPLRASPEDAAMLTALLTGDRSYLTRNLRAGFERTGSFHLIVVSGLHLAILAGCVLALARRLRIPQVPATLLTVALTLAYALFTGFAVPAQRSFWMITLYLIGRLVYRDRSPLNVIGFATLCLAAASPRGIFDASLQMTLLSVASIAGIAIPLMERTVHARIQATRDLRLISIDPKLTPKIAQFRVTLRLVARHFEAATNSRIAWTIFPLLIRTVLRLGELFFVTLVVEMALALPMAIYFHRITVYALPVNLLVLPLLGFLLPAAMLVLLVSAAWPAAAVLPAAVCLALLHGSVFVVRRMGALSLGDLRIPEPAPGQIAAALLLFLLAILLARGRGYARRCCFAALVLMAAVALWPRPIDHPTGALLFEAIDVGQGDSLLLISPEGKALLVDGGGIGLQPFGSTRRGQSNFDIGEEVVSDVLWSRGIRRLDAVALTHAHHDHMGGLPAILRNFRPRELWVGNNPAAPAYASLLREAADLGVRVRAFHSGDSIALGAVALRVLAPTAGYQPGPQPANRDSLVLQARYGATSVLLEGDAEAAEESRLAADPGLHSTVLKIGHHGSLTSTRPEFLARVAPEFAVISCGRRNRFGHPRAEILAELQAAHVRTFRTDLDGATCFELDGKSVTAQPGCGVPAGRNP